MCDMSMGLPKEMISNNGALLPIQGYSLLMKVFLSCSSFSLRKNSGCASHWLNSSRDELLNLGLVMVASNVQRCLQLFCRGCTQLHRHGQGQHVRFRQDAPRPDPCRPTNCSCSKGSPGRVKDPAPLLSSSLGNTLKRLALIKG